MGCLNVNTMHRTGRVVLVAEKIGRYGLEITGIMKTDGIGMEKQRRTI